MSEGINEDLRQPLLEVSEELRAKLTTKLAAVRAERDALRSEIACAADFVNTGLREANLDHSQTIRPYERCNLRSAIDSLITSSSLRNVRLRAEVDRLKAFEGQDQDYIDRLEAIERAAREVEEASKTAGDKPEEFLCKMGRLRAALASGK